MTLTLTLTRWKHECERVFADRLVDHKDKGWFDDALKKVRVRVRVRIRVRIRVRAVSPSPN